MVSSPFLVSHWWPITARSPQPSIQEQSYRFKCSLTMRQWGTASPSGASAAEAPLWLPQHYCYPAWLPGHKWEHHFLKQQSLEATHFATQHGSTKSLPNGCTGKRETNHLSLSAYPHREVCAYQYRKVRASHSCLIVVLLPARCLKKIAFVSRNLFSATAFLLSSCDKVLSELWISKLCYWEHFIPLQKAYFSHSLQMLLFFPSALSLLSPLIALLI